MSVMHAYQAAKAILERFACDGELQDMDGAWVAECRGVLTGEGPVELSVQLRDADDLLLLEGMDANPRERGGGTMLLEALRDYCREAQVQISFHALDGTEDFYRKFPDLIEQPPGSRDFLSAW